jgi:hypothetical protein
MLLPELPANAIERNAFVTREAGATGVSMGFAMFLWHVSAPRWTRRRRKDGSDVDVGDDLADRRRARRSRRSVDGS